MALVNGGAHLDFRTKDGATVLHKAVEKNNLEALRTLLDLGSSPNYKDMRGLTTLYYSVVYNSNPQLTEMLLHDHAFIGTADPHGWQEVHQAELESKPDEMVNFIEEAVNLSRQLNLEVDSDDVHQPLDSYNQGLTIDKLIGMQEQDIEEELLNPVQSEERMTVEYLTEDLNLIEKGLQILETIERIFFQQNVE
ncbi:SH3 and multiple ankyrin repeat domains protein 3 [Trichonephila clavipes]|nr:SH3 and multiple ankyrin repeat domains protein 3 [Trichonephila clavipes]